MTRRGTAVITGVGVVAPNGIGKDTFWRSCAIRRSGVGATSFPRATDNGPYIGGEVKEFDLAVRKFLGIKGLRNLDRTTLLALVSAKLAIEDAQILVEAGNRDTLGIVLGSTTGSVHSISQFDIDGLVGGPRNVNPATFPNTVINSPASQVAIRFGLTGLSATISTGFAAGLNALEYAADMLTSSRIDGVLVGGVEELCPETISVFQGFTSGLRAKTSSGLASNQRSGGVAITQQGLGEGGAFVFLEDATVASRRGILPYAELLSVTSGFAANGRRWGSYDDLAPERVIREALESAGVDHQEISCISVGNSLAGYQECGDSSMGGRILGHVFGSRIRDIRTISLADLCGETFSASGALQLAAAVGARVAERDLFALVATIGSVGPCAAAVLRLRQDRA